MMHWWHDTPVWQRIVICGFSMTLCVLGMYTLVWGSLDGPIAMVNHDLAELNQENQEAAQSIALLKEVEQEVFLLREKISQTIPQLPIKIEPQAFRRVVANIGKRTGVTVRLWKSQKPLIDSEQSDGSLYIVVRVEGSFYGTVQFLNELLPLSWIQTVNPLVLSRKQGAQNEAMVTTDFTITSIVSKRFQQTKEL